MCASLLGAFFSQKLDDLCECLRVDTLVAHLFYDA